MTTSDETPIEAAGRDTPATAPDAAGRGTAGPAPSPAPPPRFVVAISLRLRRALRAAADAVVPAPVAMFEQIGAFMQTHMLRAAARLRLADLLAAGPASAAELAARAGVEAESLRRLLRGLATLGVFARGRDGRFRNNRASRTLLAHKGESLFRAEKGSSQVRVNDRAPVCWRDLVKCAVRAEYSCIVDE